MASPPGSGRRASPQRAEQQHRGTHARHQVAVDAAGLYAIG
jgi:hypothetical protein